jgi:glutathione synthase/RimK-type ligase-like ATP-grasp enzyme
MKILIPTQPDDTHAIVVKLALEDLGNTANLIFTADQPTKQRNTIYINNELYKWRSNDKFNSVTDDNYEVVWWRRARKPFISKRNTHPCDYEFVSRENDLFFESFTSNLAPNAWWVNSKESARKANFKLLQLKIASECRMKIPTTLCSNDPIEVRDFIQKYNSSGVIYKPLCTNSWFEKEKVKISYASRVTLNDLPNFKLLQQSPGIFQTEIKKKYEVRVTCFGDYIVPAKISSQSHLDGIIDWRSINKYPIDIDKYKLPINLEFKIRAFMREMGLVFGTIDFIVNEQNEYIFISVNEQGQFLWIEEINPNFKMLDIFIKFILNKSPHFEWDRENIVLNLDKYKPLIMEIYNKNILNHISLKNPKYFNRKQTA